MGTRPAVAALQRIPIFGAGTQGWGFAPPLGHHDSGFTGCGLVPAATASTIAATAATTAITTTAATTTIPTTAPAAGPPAAGLTGLGLVHRQRATLHILAVQRVDGGLGLFVVGHLHKSESSRTA